MRYFAYGSNMLAERIQAPTRCKSATPLGIAYCTGYRICFIKKSRDESGKATLVETGDESDFVPGVLFEIDDTEKDLLDKAEGANGGGYIPKEDLSVIFNKKIVGDIRTYIAPKDKCDHTLPVYDWYLALVIAGAKQHKLDSNYVQKIIESNKVVKDENNDRDTKKEALQILKDSGNEAIFLELGY